MTKVLLFESDAEFAQTLSVGLQAYGCNTTVVDDGEEGIAWATENKPDLILLTIELPRMNGFSVCNKLKRHGELKSVPLVLLSSDATQETFEQHKRLRTRADEYIHKPIEVEALVEKLQAIVPLTRSEEAGDEEDLEEVTIEDASSLEDVSTFDNLSSLMDVETEEAFGNLVAPSMPAAPADEVEMDDLVLDDDDGLRVAPEEPVHPPPSPSAPKATSAMGNGSLEQATRGESLAREIAELTQTIQQLEGEVRSARSAAEAEADAKNQVAQKKDAEIELLQRELEQLRAKLESNETTGSAREFLDLREQLNRKDKEIIEIRDQLSTREKALVRVNDECIALGREKADLLDQVSGFSKSNAELEKRVSSLDQDLVEAVKRADDFKSKNERLQADLALKIDELRAARESHENAMATRDAREAAMRHDHANAMREAADAATRTQQHAVAKAIQEAEERAAGLKEEALVAAAEEAQKTRVEAIAAREMELGAEHDSKMAALHRANEESLRKLRAEHHQQSEQAAQAAAARLSTREQELEQEKQQALSSQQAENDAKYQTLLDEKHASEQRRDGRITQLESDLAMRTSERDQNAATITDRERKIEELEASLGRCRAAEVELRDQLDSQTELLAQARGKWSEDLAGIHIAEEALENALSELKKAQNRPMP